MKTVCQTSRLPKGFASCCTVYSSTTQFSLHFCLTTTFKRAGSPHKRIHVHSHCGETLAGVVSASLQRQLDDNPAGVNTFKGHTHPSHILFPPLSLALSLSLCLTHTYRCTQTLIKSCNQADFCCINTSQI